MDGFCINTDEAYEVKRLYVELIIVLLFLFLSRNYKVVCLFPFRLGIFLSFQVTSKLVSENARILSDLSLPPPSVYLIKVMEHSEDVTHTHTTKHCMWRLPFGLDPTLETSFSFLLFFFVLFFLFFTLDSPVETHSGSPNTI